MDLLTYIASKLTNVKREGRTLVARCPACAAAGEDRTGNHLKVWSGGEFHCCKAGNDKEHNRIIRAHIRPDDESSDEARLAIDHVEEETRIEVEKVYPEEMLTKLVRDHSYWMGRGIDEQVLVRLEGGLAPRDERNKLSGRYIFPIRNDARQIVGFTGRLVIPNSFARPWKHLVPTSKVCWPWYLNGAAIKAVRRVVLVESVGDLLSLMTHDIPALCLFGLNLNGKVVGNLVSTNLDRIIVSTNNDSLGKEASKLAGNKAAERIRAQLSRFFVEDKVVVRLPATRKDWNQVLVENPEELVAFKAEVEAP